MSRLRRRISDLTTDTTLSAASAYAYRELNIRPGEQDGIGAYRHRDRGLDIGCPFYGPAAVYEDKEIVQLKVLSDRRREGGGITWIARPLPPSGKLIRIVAVAPSDEHIFNLKGGRGIKTGQPARGTGGYGLNTKDQPHSAAIATETMSLIIYTGEPDEIRSMDAVDL